MGNLFINMRIINVCFFIQNQPMVIMLHIPGTDFIMIKSKLFGYISCQLVIRPFIFADTYMGKTTNFLIKNELSICWLNASGSCQIASHFA